MLAIYLLAVMLGIKFKKLASATFPSKQWLAIFLLCDLAVVWTPF